MKKLLIVSALATAMGGVWAADYTTDVVVIGSGGAGLSAAVTLHDAGKKVIVLEKMAMVGGNTLRAEGGFNAAETAQQKRDGIPDTIEQFIADTMKGGHNLNNPALLKVFTENAKYSEEWLLDLGADFCFRKGRGGGQSVARSHGPCDGSPVGPEVLRVLLKKADSIGLDIRKQNQVVDIGMKDGKISSVKVKTPKGVETLDAKAVVLATGGFGANLDMVTKYRPELKGFSTTNHPGAQGEGLELAAKLGAGFTDIEQIQIHPTVVKKDGHLISESMRSRGGILLNHDGNRFCNELLTRDVVSQHVLAQKGGEAFLVYDQSIFDSNKLSRGYYEHGYSVKGDTLEDLAKKLDMPVENVKKTFEAYWEAHKTGVDKAFGRPEMVIALDKGPWYAAKITPGIHHTMGGVTIDPETHVLTKDGKVIQGLFAAGEVTGGVHGGNRIGGNAVTDIVTFGRIAGTNAAAYADTVK